jgi:ribose 5-phosphate isomerase B
MADPVVALVADHAGFELKNALKGVLDERGVTTIDLGPHDAAPVDYPDMARKLAMVIRDGGAQRGVMICGTGIGISIAANRYPWMRAAVGCDVTTARLAREHNDANVLARGARLIGLEVGTRLSADLPCHALRRRPPRAPGGQAVGDRAMSDPPSRRSRIRCH